MRMKIDKYDKHIMYELDTNSRMPIAVLAKKVGLPKETVNYRLKRLTSNGCIRSFYAIINASHFGYRYYKVGIRLHGVTEQVEKEMVEFLKKEQTCSNLRITEGPYNIVFLAIHRTAGELNGFMERFGTRFGDYIAKKNIHKIITSYKLNQKILFGGKKAKKVFDHAEPMAEAIEKLDQKILKVLASDARVKLIDLANQMGEDPRVVAYHIKKMEDRGVIVGYSTALNFELFRLQFIQIDINLKHHGLVHKIMDFFDETNTCVFAYELLGSEDLSLELYVQNDDHLRNVLRMFKQNFARDYNGYEVSRIYEEHASNWSPFETEAAAPRPQQQVPVESEAE